jgi:hypothetical protein
MAGRRANLWCHNNFKKGDPEMEPVNAAALEDVKKEIWEAYWRDMITKLSEAYEELSGLLQEQPRPEIRDRIAQLLEIVGMVYTKRRKWNSLKQAGIDYLEAINNPCEFSDSMT